MARMPYRFFSQSHWQENIYWRRADKRVIKEGADWAGQWGGNIISSGPDLYRNATPTGGKSLSSIVNVCREEETKREGHCFHSMSLRGGGGGEGKAGEESAMMGGWVVLVALNEYTVLGLGSLIPKLSIFTAPLEFSISTSLVFAKD